VGLLQQHRKRAFEIFEIKQQIFLNNFEEQARIEAANNAAAMTFSWSSTLGNSTGKGKSKQDVVVTVEFGNVTTSNPKRAIFMLTQSLDLPTTRDIARAERFALAAASVRFPLPQSSVRSCPAATWHSPKRQLLSKRW